ncbi:ATP-binding protein [Traorella massiliensis]|uniref:ATP-binding protein n=1 Tax=Traorella massiliensis TaxID=1903263 RepID=UPI002357A149|nr:ATP-binding protein [Traorella massiliensis]
MMADLSMYLLDITSNSIRANASHIMIRFEDSKKKNEISLEIIDDGRGMDAEMVEKVQNPFFTTRTTRKIGLGIPFFKELAEQCEGHFELESKVNEGTRIKCTMKKDHWDVPPRGDIGDALVLALCMNEAIHIHFDYISDEKHFSFDSQEIREILGDVSICEAEISSWCKAYINEGIKEEEKDEVISRFKSSARSDKKAS